MQKCVQIVFDPANVSAYTMRRQKYLGVCLELRRVLLPRRGLITGSRYISGWFPNIRRPTANLRADAANLFHVRSRLAIVGKYYGSEYRA
jgi:hypothetical protein